jgi:DNA-binding PadR family transcriptional regulator
MPAHPSNPLALAVLALLFERPMHPYEMAATLKQRHKGESIKLRYGSLYTVIELLLKRGFIAAQKTAREGRRPERTVYTLACPDHRRRDRRPRPRLGPQQGRDQRRGLRTRPHLERSPARLPGPYQPDRQPRPL